MSCRKQRTAFDQVSEFERGRIVTYQDCGLNFRKIGSRVGRNQTTAIRWTDAVYRIHLTAPLHMRTSKLCEWQLASRTIRRCLQQSGLSARRPLLRLPLTQNRRRFCRQWCDERRIWVGEWNEVVFTDESPSACNTTMVGFESGDTVEKRC
ncbi:transposable element Tcb1 transposase [Trichonephila clavipes]|uniref:Transposable element Tcb1 transposase n=1 Tax=Trichonephila clavipes TaxID=2585209 RepID=A0A8X6SZT8_TRICX|nr:transposable element Tcb1 transposase [Trichonephila clavipes]